MAKKKSYEFRFAHIEIRDFSNMPAGHEVARAAGPRRSSLMPIGKASDPHQP
jgi:hypothetical protein